MSDESREDYIKRLAELGIVNIDCPSCKSRMLLEDPGTYFGPSHTASPLCQSGKHPHCTCDTCF